MTTKIQKSLDYNKLLQQQAQGKLLKKKLSFPLIAQIKYDGAYTVIEIAIDKDPVFHTSGGLQYRNNKTPEWVYYLKPGFYIAERINKGGKLGTRRYTALTGPKIDQLSTGHDYMLHDYLTYEEYQAGKATAPYYRRLTELVDQFNIPDTNLVESKVVYSMHHLEQMLKDVTKHGYEGLMLKDPDWLWEDTKSRKIECAKYKKRPTADLLCVGVTDGTGKYEGLIGALVLQDSKGRQVQVGSGLSDHDRSKFNEWFIGQVIEIEYEQLMDTYIQPTYIARRSDKTEEEID